MKSFTSLLSIGKRAFAFTALLTVVLALTGTLSAQTTSTAHWQKKGKLKITTPTEVGGAFLQPGDYEVKVVKSGSEIEFIRLTENYQAQEGLPVYEQEVVARVNYNVKPLNAKPQNTQLLFASSSAHAIGLEIRGNGGEYLF